MKENDTITTSKENEFKESKRVQSNNSNAKSESPFYVLSLKLENGSQKEILIYSNSIPAELAFEFCKEHNLDFSSLNNLTTEISLIMKQTTSTIHPINKPVFQITKEEQKAIITNQLNEKSNDKKTQESGELLLDKQITEAIPQSRTQSNLGVNNQSKISISKKLSKTQICNLEEAQLIYNPKLFVYEFNHNHELEKKNKLIAKAKPRTLNKNDSQSIYTPNHTHTNTICGDKSITASNIDNLTRLSSLSVFHKQKPQLIYERLFREASYSKIISKRKCHFSQLITPYAQANNANTQITMNHNENNSFASDSIRNMISINTVNKKCLFKPNISIEKGQGYSHRKTCSKQSKKQQITSKEIIDYKSSLNNHHKPKIISNNSYDNRKTENIVNDQQCNVYNTINIISTGTRHSKGSLSYFSVNNKSSNNQSLNEYIPIQSRLSLRHAISKSIEDEYLEAIRKEAFEKLFNELTTDRSKKSLNKETLNTTKTSQSILKQIDSILSLIIKDNQEITKEHFVTLMMELFNSLSLEEKRNVIHFYYSFQNKKQVKSESSEAINKSNCKVEKKECFFNSQTIVQPLLNRQYNGHRRYDYKNHKISLKEKQRNFYYLF